MLQATHYHEYKLILKDPAIGCLLVAYNRICPPTLLQSCLPVGSRSNLPPKVFTTNSAHSVAFVHNDPHIEVMRIRMLKKSPCNVSYGGFSYRVEPLIDETENTSHISARLLTPAGRLWEPKHEQDLTKNFPDRNGAEDAWLVGFQTKKEFFLERAIVGRMIDDGDAIEIEDETAPANRPPMVIEERERVPVSTGDDAIPQQEGV